MKLKKQLCVAASKNVVMLVLSLILGALFCFACGGGLNNETSDTSKSDSDPGSKHASLKGEVRIDGSSTVFPISEAVAEEFSKVSKVRVNVAFSGTGGGFEKFCRGETQISDASRPMKEKEVIACSEKGINDVIELQVAIDALTVVINPENLWAKCMTVNELNYAFRAGGAKKWSDIRSNWPDKDIVTFYPGVDSGTFDYFNEAIIKKEQEKEHMHRADGTPSEDDNILTLGISSDLYAIGYFGFAYYLGAGDELTAVHIDDGNGCIDPTFENAFSGVYTPLSRPLFIYTRASTLMDNLAVYGFLEYYLDNLDDLVPDVGYITMPEDQLAIMVSRLTNKIVTHGPDQ